MKTTENKRERLRLMPGENVIYEFTQSLPFEIPEIILFFEPLDRRKALDDFYVFLATNTSQPREGNSELRCFPKRFEPCLYRPQALIEKKTGNLTTYSVFLRG